jgi:hypothetical protein
MFQTKLACRARSFVEKIATMSKITHVAALPLP